MEVSTITCSSGQNRLNEISPATDVDNILKTLGGFGKYQKIQLLLICFFVLEDSFHLISSVYIAYRPFYQCEDINSTKYLQDRNVSQSSTIDISYGKCDIGIRVNTSLSSFTSKEACMNGYKYDIPKDRTTVTEWDLVCSGAERSELATTLIMLGQATGAVIFSPISDKIGRKPSNIFARIMYFFTALATVFSPNISVFLVFRFLQGTFQGGSLMTCTILYIELLPKELRHRAEGANITAWTTGLVLTSVIGYLCRDLTWRYMQLILAIITCHTLFDWFIEVEQSKDIPIKNQDATITAQSADSDEEEKSTVHKYSIFTILKNKRMLGCSIILWIAWITNSLTYYGLMLTTSTLSGDRYLNNILACLAEYPAAMVQQLFVNRIGRKCMLIIFHGIAGISMVLAMVCTTYGGENEWVPVLGTVFALLGRFAITGSFSTVFLYTSELYPTNLRNAGLGIASTIARIGSMLSPFAMTLSYIVPWGPAAVFASLNLFVTLSLLVLPETMGRELPTTVTELNSWYKDNNSCTFSRCSKKTHNLKNNINDAI
ncbi:solute carrier family 22 member 6-A-like isoform X2 [Mytilus galloprovincialis]|uniref:solute carrier family 22 member 6-A-like isoform X2 n=1 Tax=Mytilus galloprovincialis TaxID=29158 RepID=UPI003F7BACC0